MEDEMRELKEMEERGRKGREIELKVGYNTANGGGMRRMDHIWLQ
jgi:hypothetical protein